MSGINFPAGQAWPPLPDLVVSPMSGWAAWYEGTPETLSAHYLQGWGSSELRPRVRAAQLNGGIVGVLARFWWGQPQVSGQSIRGIHLPLAADIAAASSDLLFGEELDVDAGVMDTTDEDGNTVSTPRDNARLEYILQENAWNSLLPEAGELQSAMGGVYLRAGWDKDISDAPIITKVSADKALPEFRYERLQAVTFWEIVKRDGQDFWRHLERHEKGFIYHQLRKGTAAVLGQIQPLDSLDETKGLAEEIPTEVQYLTVEYVPNVRPSRRWRDVPQAVNLGRADIDGQEPLLDALDETWNSLLRDIRHGKSRLLVGSQLLMADGPGKGARVDIDRDVYEALNVPIGPNSGMADMISAQQFPIRVTEHLEAAKALTEAIVRSAGYSAQTFGIDNGTVAKTATEVDSIGDRTRQTREKKTRYWETALQKLLRTVLAIDRAQFGTKGGISEVQIQFAPDATPSPESTARTVQMLRAAEVLSVETAVRMINPSWDEPQVAEEVERLLEEKSASTAALIPDVGNFLPDETGAEEDPVETAVEGAYAGAPSALPPAAPAGAPRPVPPGLK
ncbi:phage portal protein [Tessaracoccus sp.]